MSEINEEIEDKNKGRNLFIGRVVIWSVLGFICGLTLGLLFFKGYIQDHTNECINLLNICRETLQNSTTLFLK